jgi:signal transduction histidine kinase
MALHAGAHVLRTLLWRVRSQARAEVIYFAGQMMLVASISTFARDLVVTGGLLLLLAGEAALERRLSSALLVMASARALHSDRQARGREEAQARVRALEEEQAEVRAIMAERQRMARELHDTLAQGVAGLILQLEATDAQLE